MAKVKCLYHPHDDTPSMEVYGDRMHCFACGANVTRAQYEKDAGKTVLVVVPQERVKEDLAGSLAYIKSLPKAVVRGLDLHVDQNSYYVLWPDGHYYTRRFYDEDSGRGKYKRPTGWPTPLLVAASGLQAANGGRMTLLIVEGEINALSIAAACPDIGVCSPGSAAEFHSVGGLRNLSFYLGYQRQVLIADEDAPGALACIELAKHLKPKSNDVQIVLMKKVKHGGRGDGNEILTQEGKQALREEILARIRFQVV